MKVHRSEIAGIEWLCAQQGISKGQVMARTRACRKMSDFVCVERVHKYFPYADASQLKRIRTSNE